MPMREAFFFRLLSSDGKASALTDAVSAANEGGVINAVVYVVDPASFRQVPGSPFAYWVSERIRRLFTELPPFEGGGRTAKQGLATADDFRFVRAWWEVAPQTILDGTNGPDWREDLTAFQKWCSHRTFEGKRWVPFAKGGVYSPYYADIHLVVNWARDGDEIKSLKDAQTGKLLSRPQNTDFYFRAGLTWSDRTTRLFSARVWPAGGIFSVKGSAGFFSDWELFVLGLMNTLLFNGFLSLLVGAGDAAARSYQVGTIGAVPFPVEANATDYNSFKKIILEAADIRRFLDSTKEGSHIFYLPGLLRRRGNALAAGLAACHANVAEVEQRLAKYQREIEDLALRLYGVERGDRLGIEEGLGESRSEGNDEEQDADSQDDEEEAQGIGASRQLVADLLSYAVGCFFGRWDVRFATGERQSPALPDPFAPLPVYSPGMLTGEDGLPLYAVPSAYPLRISGDGIIVDDPDLEGAQPHQDDIVHRVREVLDLLWGDRAEAIEQEVCEILGVGDLREYFRRPAGFFDDHLKRYSKSRRKAPIYWPLSTASGSYTVWVYYQRLTDQTLYTIVNRYVEPKIAEVERATAGIEKDIAIASGRQATQLRDRWQEARAFVAELHDFKQELLRVAGLPYKPDLNDGVIINAAPLHRLFRHRQ
jgi:hypothetical protein